MAIEAKIGLSELVKLAEVSLCSEAIRLDEASWCTKKASIFSVKAAYELASGWVEEGTWIGWGLIWKLKIQERLKLFLWLLAHEKIMTNSKRWRRKLAQSPLCERFWQEDESAVHVIRDCRQAREVWTRLIPMNLQAASGLDSMGT